MKTLLLSNVHSWKSYFCHQNYSLDGVKMSKMLFHAQNFMLYNSMFDDKCSDHIVSLMSHLSHSNTHTYTVICTVEWACVCILTQMHTEGWSDEWANLMLTFTYWCKALQPCIWSRKTWREKCRCRNSQIPILFLSQRRIFLWNAQTATAHALCLSRSILLLLVYSTAVDTGQTYCTWGDVQWRYFQQMQYKLTAEKLIQWFCSHPLKTKEQGPLSRITVFECASQAGKNPSQKRHRDQLLHRNAKHVMFSGVFVLEWLRLFNCCEF